MEIGLLEVILSTRDGGVWMMPVGMATVAGSGAALLFGLVTALKVRVPLALWGVMPALVLAVGANGTAWGVVETFQAAAWAPGGMVDTMVPGGMSIALITTVAALLCVVLIGVNTAWAAGLGGLVASLGAEARVSAVGALLVLVGVGGAGVVALLVATLLGLSQPFQLAAWVGLLTVVPVTLVALRRPAVDDDDEEEPAEAERHRRREARVHEVVRVARTAAAGGLVLASAAATTAAFVIGRSSQLRILATAPPELRETAVQAWSDGVTGTVLGALVTLVALGVALALVALGGRGEPRRGRLPWGLAAAGLAVLPVASVAYAVVRTESLPGRFDVRRVDVEATLEEVAGPPRLERVGPYLGRADLVGTVAVWQRNGDLETRESTVRIDGKPPPEDALRTGIVPWNAILLVPSDLLARDFIAGDFGDPSFSGKVLVALPEGSERVGEGTWPLVEFDLVERTGADKGQEDHLVLADGRVLRRASEAWEVLDPSDTRPAVVHVEEGVPLHRLLSYCTERTHCQVANLTRAEAATLPGGPLPSTEPSTP